MQQDLFSFKMISNNSKKHLSSEYRQHILLWRNKIDIDILYTLLSGAMNCENEKKINKKQYGTQ